MNRPDWDEYPCKEWTGCVMNTGYGKIPDQRLAHRAAFEEYYGFLPEAPYVVDHLCRNRVCIEPKHLQSVTRAENTRLGSTRREWPTRCPRGHNEWRVRKNGSRRCNRCHIIAETKRNRRKREQAAADVG